MHPRLGIEQYKKPVDIDAFAEFYEACTHSVVYNGDLLTLQDIRRVETTFPKLKGIMFGRGLLANPAVGLEYSSGKELTNKERAALVRKMHDKMHDVMAQRLQGNTQYLSKLNPYWEYLLPDMLKRDKKAILKATTIEKYMYAVNEALANY
jgi:tRNA-dihydrouridine synthase